MKTIALTELKDALGVSGQVILLEALPTKYFREGHLPGAVHFPNDLVGECAAKILPDRSARIVVYCASETCKNSHQVAEELIRLGFTKVAVFVGGKKEWVAAGLPLETLGDDPLNQPGS